MTITMQSQEDLEAQYAAVLGRVSAQAGEEEPGYYEGVADALGWVLHRSQHSPITQARIARPTPAEVMAEHRLAEDILYRRRNDQRSREWVGGVDHGLLWAAGGTSDSPVAAPPKLRTMPVIRDEIADLEPRLTAPGYSDPYTQDRITAALGVLAWVAGDTTTAPLTKRVADEAPGVPSIKAEVQFIAELRKRNSERPNHSGLLSDGDPLPGVSWAFVGGTEQALRWVMALTDRSVS